MEKDWNRFSGVIEGDRNIYNYQQKSNFMKINFSSLTV